MSEELITADWHLGLVNDSWVSKNGIESKINESFKQIDYMIDYMEEKKIRKMKILGDIFNGKRPAPLLYEMLIQRLNRLEKLGITTDILLGNHSASNSSRNALVPIKEIGYKNIKIWDDVGYKDEDGIRWIFCPHIVKSKIGLKFEEDNEKQMEGYLKDKIHSLVKPRTILLGHLQYKGAVVGSEETLLEGGVNFFPQIDKKNILRIFLGHIHRFQMIKWNGVEIVYPGSLVRCDFGEREEEKGFIIYDNKKDDWEFFKLDTIEYKQINIDLVSKDHIDLDDEKIKRVAKGKILKIVINVSEENRKKINIEEIESAFSKHGFISKIDRNVVSSDKKKKARKFSLNPEVVFREYIEDTVEDEGKKKKLIDLGMKIIDEVRENIS